MSGDPPRLVGPGQIPAGKCPSFTRPRGSRKQGWRTLFPVDFPEATMAFWRCNAGSTPSPVATTLVEHRNDAASTSVVFEGVNWPLFQVLAGLRHDTDDRPTAKVVRHWLPPGIAERGRADGTPCHGLLSGRAEAGLPGPASRMSFFGLGVARVAGPSNVGTGPRLLG